MNIRDAIFRSYNLLGATIVGISGLAFFPEIFTEDELTHKLDEGVLFLLAIGSIVWYFVGRNRYSRTIIPILFVAGALIMKVIAFLLEAGDPADQGDEFGAIILFVLALVLVIWQYVSIKRIVEQAEMQEKVTAASSK